MDIITATKIALRNNLLIKRKVWENFNFAIMPTDLCYAMIKSDADINNQERYPLWNPKTEDVLADDWAVTER